MNLTLFVRTRSLGRNLQSTLDVVNLTQSEAGLVSTVEPGDKIRAIEVLDTTNTVDDLVRDKK